VPFPPGRDGSPSYSQHTPANARVQGLGAIFTAFRLGPGRVEAPRMFAVGPEVRPYPGAEGQDPAVGTPPLHLETTWSRRQPVRRVRILAVDALLESAPVWNFYG